MKLTLKNLIELYDSEYRSEYRSEYSEMSTKRYIEPKIYHGGENFDLSKRWYVYYSFTNPDTGKMVRQAPLYLGGNLHLRTVVERLDFYNKVRLGLSSALKKGTSPYKNYITKGSFSAENAVNYVISIKKDTVSEITVKGYTIFANKFIKFLKTKRLDKHHIKFIKKAHLIEHLNRILKETSPANYNSNLTFLILCFQILKDNDVIFENVASSIKKIKHKPKRNKTYTDDQLLKLNGIIEKRNDSLNLMVKLVQYNFLRPVEACRLKVSDLKLNSTPPVLEVRAKNKIEKTKIIPSIMIEELKKYDLSNPNAHLITIDGVSETDLSEVYRRSYFGKIFSGIKKSIGIGDDYTLYSFRHTYSTKMYRKLRETKTPFEAKSTMILITGHNSMSSLEKYLRDIDAELPEDYSNLLK